VKTTGRRKRGKIKGKVKLEKQIISRKSEK
jgi:hypothetical protein